MSSYLQIRNFKCIAETTIELRCLNVLCGRNGAGKSTVTQALLLHHAAVHAVKAGSSEVALNGPAGLNLGTAADVLYRGGASTESSVISISFGDKSKPISFDFEPEDKDEDANALRLTDRGRTVRIPESPWEFVYLSAERIGPRISQEKLSNLPRTQLSLGEFGENAAEVLRLFERSKIREGLLHPEERTRPKREQNRRVLRNLELWLGAIFGALQVRVDSNGTYAPPTVLIRSSSTGGDWILTTNYGFGVTYCLPILLAGLLMRENGVLIVDGPEAHLHPAAQTAMARFLAVVAASGCTVVIETHSDHIMDGVRLAVAGEMTDLRAADCVFLNFNRGDTQSIEITPISVDANGSLSAWPRGFFDQQTHNLRALASRKSK